MTTLHDKYQLSRVINARGTFTPLGVSRCSEPVIEATAESLRHFFDMGELAEKAGCEIARMTGAEWGAVTHCSAASITLGCAAIMTRGEDDRIAQLPDVKGLNSTFVIQTGHLVNYGQPIEQAIRLSGAKTLAVGSRDRCTTDELVEALNQKGVAGLVLVASRLCVGDMVSLADAIDFAHDAGLPVMIDAAAQDLQMESLLELGAELTIFSAQKYLASPTASLVIGKKDWVEAVHAQERGIGRGMKAGKEAIVGAITALRCRYEENQQAWSQAQQEKADIFVDALNEIACLRAELVPDSVGNPFSRVRVWTDPKACGRTASEIERTLIAGEPIISVQDHSDSDRALMFEIVGLTQEELMVICARLSTLLA